MLSVSQKTAVSVSVQQTVTTHYVRIQCLHSVNVTLTQFVQFDFHANIYNIFIDEKRMLEINNDTSNPAHTAEKSQTLHRT